MDSDDQKRIKLRVSQLIDYHREKAQEYQARAMGCDHPVTQEFLSGQATQHGQWARDIEFLRGWMKEVTPVDTE